MEKITKANIRAIIGCSVSKAAVMQLIQDVGKPGRVYLVAEDDWGPVPNLAARLPRLLATAPPDWDVLQLDPAGSCGGTHALLVPFEKAGKLKDLYTGKLSGSVGAADCMLHKNGGDRKPQDVIHVYKAKWHLFQKVKAVSHLSTIPGHKFRRRRTTTSWKGLVVMTKNMTSSMLEDEDEEEEDDESHEEGDEDEDEEFDELDEDEDDEEDDDDDDDEEDDDD